MRRFCITLLSLVLLPSSLYAFDLTVGVGVKGGINGSVANGIEEGGPFTLNGSQQSIAQGPDLYPVFGIGGGVGPVVEVRALDMFGLELGVFTSWDNGNGFEDQNALNGATLGRIDQEQRTRSLRLPIMAKAAIPGFVRPTFGLGVELVFQQSSELKYSSDEIRINNSNNFGNITYEIEPSTYALLAFSFALEFDVQNFRIPIEIRGGINPGFSKDIDSRLNSATSNGGALTLVYDGKYQAHFAVFTGVVYDFDLKL